MMLPLPFSGRPEGTRFFVLEKKKRVPSALPPKGVRYLLILIFVATAARAELTRPAGIDAPLWDRMTAVDAKADKIDDLTADFEQRKFTPLLKKPLISKGTVRAKGASMLWDTQSPEPTIMRVDEKELRLYYPNQKTVEIYPISGQLGALAASPLPRLSALLPHFTFAPASPKDLGEEDRPDRLAIRMTPIDKELAEHVESVTVLIDTERGFILVFQLIDADGERTVIRFSHMKTNTHLDDSRLRLNLPAEVKTVRPLENLGDPSGSKDMPTPKSRQ